ncbi:MAG: hypothetical protein COC10_03775 [Sphingobium sp.]|jgi:Na+/melibiose symporter-like transporter|nr:MAG: hypothetical protein COC10_03775 [Sphingobium sp.]
MRLADCWRGSELPYALAHASKTLFWTASDIYFAFYLTQVCGLSPWTMGLVLAASYLVNAAADLILGRRFSATVRSAEQAAQMQASGAALCSITLVLFGLSALVSSGARLAACLLALMAFRLSYSLYDIPQNSLLALAGRDDRMRARLAATRLFISGIARIILTASFVPLFVRRSTEAQIEAFLLLVCLMAFLSLVSAFALRTKLKGAVSAIAFDDASPAERKPATTLHLMMMALSFGTTIFTQLEPYLAAFILPSRWDGAALLTSVAFGTSISPFAWMAAIRRAGRRSVAITALLLTGGSVALFFSATLNGGLPMILAGLSYGISVGGLFFLLWTGIAHHAARSHDAYGATATMGAFAGSAKVGQSVAMIMVGLSLQRWGPGASAWEGPPLVAAMAGAVGTALVLLIGLALWDKHVLASTRQS